MFSRAKDTEQNNIGVHFVGVSYFYDSAHADTVMQTKTLEHDACKLINLQLMTTSIDVDTVASSTVDATHSYTPLSSLSKLGMDTLNIFLSVS